MSSFPDAPDERRNRRRTIESPLRPRGAWVASTVVLLCVASEGGTARGGVYEERRAAAVEAHDRNGDGRLDPSEREAMRLQIARERLGARSSSRIPRDFLDKYDTDKDGEMAPGEWKVAWDAETRILIADHDADGDGQLNGEEKKALMKSVREGRVTGVPAFFASRLAESEERGTEDFLKRSRSWLEADADGDGRASREELERLRNRPPAGTGTAPQTPDPKP